jgi:hypothetical protein
LTHFGAFWHFGILALFGVMIVNCGFAEFGGWKWDFWRVLLDAREFFGHFEGWFCKNWRFFLEVFSYLFKLKKKS